MSSKKFSPAARLLRNSKLVSMPAPLPVRPLSSGLTPHPTHQAITAPASSLSRGDWGLKRNLPSKILGEYARYDELDNFEHRTTFDSAQDFVFTLKKWQEMGVSVRKGAKEKGDVSAFSKNNGVWGQRKPYLPNMTIPQAKLYIKKYILPRREAFLRHLARLQLNQQRLEKLQGNPNFKIKTPEKATSLRETAESKPDTVLKAGIAGIRRDRIALRRLVAQYLKLPTSEPLRTHPSAGLYYTLGDSHMTNDWEHGLLGRGRTYIGRDLGNSVDLNSQSLVALAGFVTHITSSNRGVAPTMTRWDPIELVPYRAEIKQNGRVDLRVFSPTPERPVQAAADLLKKADSIKPTSPIPQYTNAMLSNDSTSKRKDTSKLSSALVQLLDAQSSPSRRL